MGFQARLMVSITNKQRVRELIGVLMHDIDTWNQMEKIICLGLLLIFPVSALGFGETINQTNPEIDGKSLMDNALILARKIENPFDRTMVLVYIAMSHADIRQDDKAFKILSQAYRSTKRIKDTSDKSKAMAYVAGKFTKIGKSQYAIQITRKIKNDYYRNETLKEIGIISPQVSRTKDSDSVAIAYNYLETGEFDKAFQMSQLVTEGRSKSILLANIGVKYFKNEQKDKAVETFLQSIRVAKGIESHNNKDSTLAEIAHMYAEAGQYQEAVQLVQTIEGYLSKSSALADIVREYARNNEYDQAVQVAQTIGAPLFKATALFWIAQKHVEDSQYEQAIQIIETIEDKFQKVFGLSYVAGRYTEIKQKEKARELLYRALHIAESTENVSQKAMMLAEIGKKCVKKEKD